ncbi:MAG: prepilin-type N-terminal cleavage/methylation domain-containing protein [Eubacterium sp.]|nr:prepilin-type N-terminal cleavage/methylation domain-containing protein [Eubacterium sp.]MBR1674999.1 prepilin-type N-terminal cleavage/methylation domain-containing protein [Eubacterium sp.]
MVLNNKKNKGFTLVELIVAVAVLALLITAVVTMMGHESVILKKHEADISVQTSAQETYNEISDIIMQANSIKIKGWTADATIEFDKKKPGKEIYNGMTISYQTFTKKSLATGIEKNFEDNGVIIVGEGDTASGVFLKTVTKSGTNYTSVYRNFYVDEIIVTYSVPYDSSFAGEGVTVPSGTDKDTCTADIIFDGNKIYITKTYSYMTKLNSTFDETSSDAEKDACLYTSKLNYATVAMSKVSAAVATIDVENQSISLELQFADNGMAYNINGITNVKNSNVFIDAK